MWEETISNINNCSPTIAMYIGGFNTRNAEWWNGDSTNMQGTELVELVAQYSLNQVIDWPTQVPPNSASCTDLISTTETNFVTGSGVLPSQLSRCHHQLILAKVNFTTFFPPPTGRESGISQGLTSMLSGELRIALIRVGH